MLRNSLVVVLALAAAGQAGATVGSVISSFRVRSEYASNVDAIYRDSSHVYCMVWHWWVLEVCWALKMFFLSPATM